jgi:hypothetical protein
MQNMEANPKTFEIFREETLRLMVHPLHRLLEDFRQ